MAALTGYSSGEVLRTKASNYLPPAFGDVFKPAIQTIGTLTDFITNNETFLFENVYTHIWRKETSKVLHFKRVLGGANSGGGPAGERPGRYSDDFYHRIHLTPSRLKLGNLISTQTREIEVWNAYFHSVDLDDVQLMNGDGLVITPPVATPYVMRALEPLVYIVSISTDGPPAINATIRWTVDDIVLSTDDYDARITGNRVIPITMAPNWSTEVIETLEWKTDIIKSYNGEEQRSRVRSKPRRGQSYYYTLVDNDAANLDNLLWGWQSRLYAIPHWSEVTLNQIDLFQGQTGIIADTDRYSWTAGCLFFITDGVNYEMQEVLTVEPGQVNLKKGLDKAWGRPSVIGPANLARIDGDFSVKSKRLTSNVNTATIQFLHEPVQTDPFIPVAAAVDLYEYPKIPSTFNEILLKEPNWKDGLDTEFESEGKVLDFGLQGFATSVRSGIPDIVEEYEWLLNGRDQMLWFREFLGRREGKFNGFWMPNWKLDFMIQDTTLSGANGFVATANYYGLLVNGANGRNHVMVELKTGERILRNISAATQDELLGTVNVVTDETMGYTFEPEDVRIACLMGWYRLYSDKVTIRYLDKNVAVVKMSLVNVLI